MASRRTLAALVSVGIETVAGKKAVGKPPRSRSSGEHRNRDAGWRDGCLQDAAL